MKGPAKRRPGQPLVVFLLLVMGWIGIRLALWESPIPQIAPFTFVARPPQSQPLGARKAGANVAKLHGAEQGPVWAYQVSAPNSAAKRFTTEESTAAWMPPAFAVKDSPAVPAPQEVPRPLETGQMLVLPDISPRNGPRGKNPSPQPPDPDRTAPTPAARWSLDSWLFLRPDAALSVNPGPRFATYGASQAGAVLRYRLHPSSRFREAAYLRASKALAAGRETEVAAGLSAVPFRSIPVAAHAELRATRGPSSTQVRPAAFAVTEVPPVSLPLGLRGLTYLAAGYVGGDFATAFVDGQARIDGEILHFERGSVRVGGGTWGGAQKGAARLDIGPSASVDVQLGAVPARLAVDYRLRAAGAAEPRSGIAITLSTGF